VTAEPETPSPITATMVHAEAIARFSEDEVDAYRLSETYQAMQSMERRLRHGVYYTPQGLARPMTTLALRQAIGRVGPGAQELPRLGVCDPACGCGVFLVEAANLLAANYAGRLVDRQPDAELVNAVMPRVILECVFGMDIDPVAAELARLALSLETGATLRPDALARHVVCGNPLAGDSPPAMDERTGPARGAPPSPGGGSRC
jgi:hypothetical protein